MPRILICTPTATLHGGVERILEALATHLPSRGFETVFGLAKGRRFHDPETFRRALPSVQGVAIEALSGTAYGRRRAVLRAIREVDPDLVLIARMFDAYPAAAEAKRRGHRLRLTVTIQAMEDEYFLDLARYREFVDGCVASGELIRRATVERAGMPADRVVSIPGGVAAARRPVEPHGGPLRLGYVGRVQQLQKRIRDLVALDAELRRRGVAFTIDVAGTGSEEAELRAALPEARFQGWMSTEELYSRLYPELDVFVHFAEFEGVTIAPREAMAHGAVPVISRFPGVEEEGIFVDGETALTFPVGDVAAAADAVERLDRDRALLARLSAAARASQGGIRSEQGAIEAWASFFRETLEKPRRIGTTLPEPPRDHGLLTRLHVPPLLAELVRKFRGLEHSAAGDEWPHWSGIRE